MDDGEVIAWLLEGDHVVRWRVLRDLAAADDRTVAGERAKIGVEGWGAFLLAKQDRRGTWGGGLYAPKWISTFYTLLLLKEFGLDGGDARARHETQVLFEEGRRDDGGLRYGSIEHPIARREPAETCVSGMGLGIMSRFGCSRAQLEPLVGYLLRRPIVGAARRSGGGTAPPTSAPGERSGRCRDVRATA